MKCRAIMYSCCLVASLAQCLIAAEAPSASASAKKAPDTSEDKASSADPRHNRQVRHAREEAIKAAEREFLRVSPEGIAYKQQLDSLDQELNTIYERYLNISREDPASEKGKAMRQERAQLLRAVNEKRKKIAREFEDLKRTSPAYHDILEKLTKAFYKKYVSSHDRNKTPEQVDNP